MTFDGIRPKLVCESADKADAEAARRRSPSVSSLLHVALSPDETAATLTAEGYVVRWDHHDGPYGSWFIEIEHAPRLQLTFDGRDGRLTLRWETERLFGGVRQWDPLWVGQSETDLTTATAVQMVRSATEFAKTVRDSTP
jgi:hypothetical protein